MVKRKRTQSENKEGNKWEYNKLVDSFSKKLTRNIIEKTYDNAAIAFIILRAISKGTLGAFLRRPTYYIDDPSEFLGEINMFKERRIEEKEMKRTILRLQKYKLVRKNKNSFIFTKKGKDLADKILGYKQRLEKEWDGKYRLVIFDIPEIYRHHRNWLRQELYFLGYEKLQNSVFVSKLSLTKDVIKEIKKRDIENYVNYLLVEHIYDLKKGLLDVKK